MATTGLTPLTSEVPCVYVGSFRLSRYTANRLLTLRPAPCSAPDGSAGFGPTRERSFDSQNWRRFLVCLLRPCEPR